jgi:hypothetical protein
VAVPASLVFESFGLVAEVACDDPGLLDASLGMLPPGWQQVSRAPTTRFGLTTRGAITLDGVEMHRASDHRTSLLQLGALVRHHLASQAPEHVFIHAGVVEIDGRAVLIPGVSQSGKTTLVAALVDLGATYCSDEYAVVDAKGMIHPFAKPLSIRPLDGTGLGDPVEPPPAQVATRPLSSGVIVLTSYKPGARWCPSVRARGEGAFALLQNTVPARLRPDAALQTAARLARDALVLSGDRGEATQTAAKLLAIIEDKRQ